MLFHVWFYHPRISQGLRVEFAITSSNGEKIAGPWHSKAIKEGIPLQWVGCPLPSNRPFDSATALHGRSKEFEGCSKTLQHYLEIGSVVPLKNQDDTAGVWSIFFPERRRAPTS